MRIKRKELTKHDPRFISSEMARKLYDAKLSKLDSQERYEAKRKANGNKPLNQPLKDRIEKLESKLAIKNKKNKIFLALLLVSVILNFFNINF